MLYSYYETRAGGRNKGAISTRGSIQVGKYYPNTSGLGDRNFITQFSLLKGHPFERHFDLTPENISKIASIILGNTEGAYRMPEQQVNEFASDGFDGFEDDNRVPMHFVIEKELYNPRSKWKKSYKPQGGGVALFATKQEAIQAAEKFSKLDPNREFKYGGTQMAQVDEGRLNEFAPPEDNGEDDDDNNIQLPYYDSTRKTKWVDGVSKGRKEKFVNFRAVDTGRVWAIVGDTLKDGSVKISHTPSKDLAQYLVSAYLMKNSR
jgi:hypothetical protein